MMKPFLRLSLSVFCGVSIAAAAWAGASAISPKMQQQGEGSFQNTSLSKAAKDTKRTTQRNPNVRQATFRAGEAPLYLYAAVMNSDGWTPNLREPGIFR